MDINILDGQCKIGKPIGSSPPKSGTFSCYPNDPAPGNPPAGLDSLVVAVKAALDDDLAIVVQIKDLLKGKDDKTLIDKLRDCSDANIVVIKQLSVFTGLVIDGKLSGNDVIKALTEINGLAVNLLVNLLDLKIKVEAHLKLNPNNILLNDLLVELSIHINLLHAKSGMVGNCLQLLDTLKITLDAKGVAKLEANLKISIGLLDLLTLKLKSNPLDVTACVTLMRKVKRSTTILLQVILDLMVEIKKPGLNIDVKLKLQVTQILKTLNTDGKSLNALLKSVLKLVDDLLGKDSDNGLLLTIKLMLNGRISPLDLLLKNLPPLALKLGLRL